MDGGEAAAEDAARLSREAEESLKDAKFHEAHDINEGEMEQRLTPDNIREINEISENLEAAKKLNDTAAIKKYKDELNAKLNKITKEQGGDVGKLRKLRIGPGQLVKLWGTTALKIAVGVLAILAILGFVKSDIDKSSGTGTSYAGDVVKGTSTATASAPPTNPDQDKFNSYSKMDKLKMAGLIIVIGEIFTFISAYTFGRKHKNGNYKYRFSNIICVHRYSIIYYWSFLNLYLNLIFCH